MKKIFLILVSTVLLGAGLASCTPSDEKIQKEVTGLLSSYADTKVDVKDGVLTLSGKVDSDSIKGVIAKTLGSVKGVKSVVNNLQVPPPVVINPDTSINTIISTALSAGGFSSVVAQVKDGEVTLTGDLKRADLIKVMQIVNESSPKKVINQLKLK